MSGPNTPRRCGLHRPHMWATAPSPFPSPGMPGEGHQTHGRIGALLSSSAARVFVAHEVYNRHVSTSLGRRELQSTHVERMARPQKPLCSAAGAEASQQSRRAWVGSKNKKESPANGSSAPNPNPRSISTSVCSKQ